MLEGDGWMSICDTTVHEYMTFHNDSFLHDTVDVAISTTAANACLICRASSTTNACVIAPFHFLQRALQRALHSPCFCLTQQQVQK